MLIVLIHFILTLNSVNYWPHGISFAIHQIIIFTKCIESVGYREAEYFPFFIDSISKSALKSANEISSMRTYYLVYYCNFSISQFLGII